MKVKSFRAPRVLLASVAQGRAVLRGAWMQFNEGKLFALGCFVGALGLGACIWPHDRSLLETVHRLCHGHQAFARDVAWYLGTFGDYLTYNVPFALAVWLYGAVTKSSFWRRAAIIYFLGATLAGLFDDCLRLTIGRPRPDAHLPDGFYGLPYALRGGYQSFPSGHAASVFGAAIALLLTEFPLGLLTTLFALCVVWARMELDRHYPSDVAVGAIIGVYFGLLVGFGAKLRVRRIPDS